MVINEIEKTNKQNQGREKEIDIAVLNRMAFQQRPEGDGRERRAGQENSNEKALRQVWAWYYLGTARMLLGLI